MVIGPAMRHKTFGFHGFGSGPQTGRLMSSALAVGYEGTTNDCGMFLRITSNLDYGMF